MAAKKVKLSAPSEFLAKPRKLSPRKTESYLLSDKQVLLPPSKYTSLSTAYVEVKQGDNLRVDEKSGLNPEIEKKVAQRSSTTDLLEEIQKCKEQNSLLEKNLTRQIGNLLDENRETSKTDLSKVKQVYAELKRSQEQSGLFHASLQKQIEKQAETIEKLTEQYIERQNDLTSENEALRRKLFRSTEEQKEMKLYLEKEIEVKENAGLNFLSDLRKSNQTINNMKDEMEHERNQFFLAIQAKERLLNKQEDEMCKIKEQNRNYLSSKNGEIENVKNTFNKEISLLKAELEAKKSDLKLAKKKYKESVTQMKEKLHSFDLEVKNLKIENEKLKKASKEQNDNFEHLRIIADKEKNDNLKLIGDLKKQLEIQAASNITELNKVCENYEIKVMKELALSKELQVNLDKITNQLQNSDNEIEKLHAYIAEKVEDDKMKKIESQMENIKEENVQLRETCRSLESTNELLNVRLVSLNNVIKIQETEISKDGVAFAGEKTAGLLNKWRDKVYSLLVQLKSQQIMENEDIKSLQIKLQSYQSENADNKCKIALLSNQLTEKSAELEMRINNEKQIAKERDYLQNKETEHKIIIDNYCKCFRALCPQLKSAMAVVDEDMEKFSRGMTSLKALESRVSFAKDRLRTVEELMSRRDVIWQSKMDAALNKKRTENETDSGEACRNSLCDHEILSNEVVSLTKDRQLLLNQIKLGTEELSHIKTELDLEYKGKLIERENHIEELEHEAGLQNDHINKLSSEISHLCEEKEEIDQELQALKFDAQRNQALFEKALESKLDEERRSFTDELAKKDMTIEQAQREHTKTIVSLRQIERQLAWQKQNTADLIKDCNSEHKFEIENINKKAINLEKERNLLLATIKQESIKIPTLRPVTFNTSLESDNEHLEVSDVRLKNPHRKKTQASEQNLKKRKSKSKDSDKLEGMLKELESISSALLKEDFSSQKLVDVEIQDDYTSSL